MDSMPCRLRSGIERYIVEIPTSETRRRQRAPSAMFWLSNLITTLLVFWFRQTRMVRADNHTISSAVLRAADVTLRVAHQLAWYFRSIAIVVGRQGQPRRCRHGTAPSRRVTHSADGGYSDRRP
jgi:hypothetical protein